MKTLPVEQITFYYSTLNYSAKDAPILFNPDLTPIHRYIARAEGLAFQGQPVTYRRLCHRSLMAAALTDNDKENKLKYQQFKRHLISIMIKAKRMEHYELCANLRDAIDDMNSAFDRYLSQTKDTIKNIASVVLRSD